MSKCPTSDRVSNWLLFNVIYFFKYFLFVSSADGQYMSFGLSGAPSQSVMVGGDVVTAWLERETGRGFAQDYHLGAKAQCAGGIGSCPDAESQVRLTSEIIDH